MLTKFVEIAARHGSATGAPSTIPRLVVRSAVAPTGPIPALFEPKFYLLLQGAKRMTIGGASFEVEPGTSAVASVGLPFTSEVIEASATVPYLSVELKLDAGLLANLLLELPERAVREARQSGALSIEQIDESIVDPLGRLLGLLDTPSDIPVLAAQVERELYYRLLAGPLGSRMRQVGSHSARFGQIKKAAEWIAENADQSMSVEWLSAHVGMSVTSFHRHFKAVTAHTPLAYQRCIRLLDARRRLAAGPYSVTETAFASGYASASQFSREYKRAFGISPVRDAASSRRSKPL
ncbi:MAG: AraC family transcriptional regulator [Rhizobiaceae bacterium]|nr:MAG: AraC family transcriptional regulator [Rhizobiaceae bacterium]